MAKLKVECSKKRCKFKESYSSLLLARMAIEDHRAETRGYSLGAHEAVVVEKPARITRSLTGRRRLRRVD